MKRNISLYIDGLKADLDDASFILFNYTFTDISCPATIWNSASKSVTLPATPTNVAIFDHCGLADRVTGQGFSALKRTPFKVFSEMGEILEEGYLKLDKIGKGRNGIKAYNVTLYGGLGGYLYDMMYNEDGSKRTLASLRYFWDNGGYCDTTASFPINAATISEAWERLDDRLADYFIYGVFNFAPCYNGFPSCKFDANKAIYKRENLPGNCFTNIVTSKTEDGVTYLPQGGTQNSPVLLTLAEKHTEWEMEDLRAYLQRPLIRIKWFLQSLANAYNSGGYTVTLQGPFFTASNPVYDKGCITLPMFDRDNIDPSTATLADLLKDTASPADYLIGLAKVFGLVMLYDNAERKVTVMSRDDFFAGGSDIDLTGRVDRGEDYEFTPTMLESRNYLMGVDVQGAFATDYEGRYGLKYGAKRIITGYEFSKEAKAMLEGTPFKGCAEVMDANKNYIVASSPDHNYHFFKFFRDTKFTLYAVVGGETKTLECTPELIYPSIYSYNSGHPYHDFADRPQLADNEGKGASGDGVLLFLDGFVDTPTDTTDPSATFHLSDDSQAMTDLNGGTPCWSLSLYDNAVMLSQLPKFSRFYEVNGANVQSMELGNPMEVGIPGYSLAANSDIYSKRWKNYIEDLFDTDTAIQVRKVNLSGMQVGQSLLRNFYFFENSWWVMNRISDFSMTTEGLTSCEFIKVQGKVNYNNGQTI